MSESNVMYSDSESLLKGLLPLSLGAPPLFWGGGEGWMGHSLDMCNIPTQWSVHTQVTSVPA